MRLHFSIGGYDFRWTTRFRQGIHFSITQVLFADHVHWRSGVDNKFFPQVSTLMQGDTHFPNVRRKLLFHDPLILTHFWPASTLLRAHLALVTLSLLVNDDQILEHWGYAHEVHLDQCNRAKDFGSTNEPNVKIGPFKDSPKRLSYVSSHQTRDLECFADKYNIP